jgi:hypothetical protein
MLSSLLLPRCSSGGLLWRWRELIVAVWVWGSGKLVIAGAKENLMEMFGSVGKKLNEAARKTEGIAGDVWQHRECVLIHRHHYSD